MTISREELYEKIQRGDALRRFDVDLFGDGATINEIGWGHFNELPGDYPR